MKKSKSKTCCVKMPLPAMLIPALIGGLYGLGIISTGVGIDSAIQAKAGKTAGELALDNTYRMLGDDLGDHEPTCRYVSCLVSLNKMLFIRIVDKYFCSFSETGSEEVQDGVE